MFCGPSGRGRISEALKGRIGKAWQDVGEVIAYRDVEAATAFDHREDSGYSQSGLLIPDMDPVAPAEGDGPHGVLGEVVAEFQFRIIEEADRSFPDAQCVGTALAGSALGQHRLAHVLDVSVEFELTAVALSRGAERDGRHGPCLGFVPGHRWRTTH